MSNDLNGGTATTSANVLTTEAKPAEKQDSENEFKPIASQEDLDRIVETRLNKERKKYADYDDLKSEVESAREVRQKLKELEDKDKDEVTKLSERLDALTSEVTSRDSAIKERDKKIAALELDKLRAEVASEKKLTVRQAKRLFGSTREELEADADELLSEFKTEEPQRPGVYDRPLQRGGRPSSNSDDNWDAAALADKIMSGG